MKCPLRDFIATEGPGGQRVSGEECIKEECAWWDETQALCSIKNISQQLGYISTDLTQMLDKMPVARE